MNKTPIAKDLAKMGRYGDTMLAHINPQEAALLKMLGGSGTINPHTGLPEFNWWSDRWEDARQGASDLRESVVNTIKQVIPYAPIIIGFAFPQLIPLIGSSVLGTTAAAAGLAEAAAGSAIMAATLTGAATGFDVEKMAKAAALAAVSTGVGGNVAQKVGEAVKAAGGSETIARLVASSVGAASGTAATGGDVLTSAAQGFAGSAVQLAKMGLLGTASYAPSQEDKVLGLIESTAKDIAQSESPRGVELAGGVGGTATDVTAPTTGALQIPIRVEDTPAEEF